MRAGNVQSLVLHIGGRFLPKVARRVQFGCRLILKVFDM
jgi:hypothetical protein